MAFPRVGIGVTADGLRSLEAFFANLPENCGIAFILAPHLDMEAAGALEELLAGCSRLPVLAAADGMIAQPGYVYLGPTGSDMEIIQGALHLKAPQNHNGMRMPIDLFLRSLAHDQGERAICIILSGTGADGTLGMREIRAELGMTMVLGVNHATGEDQPVNGSPGRLADFVLPAEQMPAQLLAYIKRSGLWAVPQADPAENGIDDVLAKIFATLRSQTGHDFSFYKKNTIYRRIERRMHLHQMENATEYVRYLEQDEAEVVSLFKELLIHVTSFFRDPEAFEFLKTNVLLDLLAHKQNDDIRIWVPGCSTGEEVYSLAIILRECMDKLKRDFSVQIFGTDIDDDAVETARSALYPPAIASEVRPDRLPRFFSLDKNLYKVKKRSGRWRSSPCRM